MRQHDNLTVTIIYHFYTAIKSDDTETPGKGHCDAKAREHNQY